MGDVTGLMLDLGNSSVKWRLRKDGSCQAGTCSHEELDEDPFAGMAEKGVVPDKILLSAVTPSDLKSQLIKNLRSIWPDADFQLLGSPASGFGLTNGYRNTAQLGVDRWLAMVAAWSRWGEALVVVDSGTAMTVDLVDGNGVFRGGIIFPGFGALETVFHKAAPHLELPADQSTAFPPVSTADAIATGISMGSVAVIEKFVDNATAAIGEHPRLVLTGGGRRKLADALGANVEICENLVLDGLEIYFDAPVETSRA